MQFNPHFLTKEGNSYYITSPVAFNPRGSFQGDELNSIFEFAYNMSFGSAGEHRNHRSGGIYNRKNGEIFVNTFQGKLAEFAIYQSFQKIGIETEKPNLEEWALGKWDDLDFSVDDKKLSVKSTKYFGNLLLLETKDWNKDGNYIPNVENDTTSKYNFFLFVRIKPDSEKIMRLHRLLYLDNTDKEELRKILYSEKWEYDIPGFILFEELIFIIKNNYVLPQKALLNNKTLMDAENYYIQTGDMHPFEEISIFLKNK